MANPQRVLDEAIEEFELKARSWAPLEQLQELATLAYEASLALREDTEVPDERAMGVLPPNRTHDLG